MERIDFPMTGHVSDLGMFEDIDLEKLKKIAETKVGKYFKSTGLIQTERSQRIAKAALILNNSSNIPERDALEIALALYESFGEKSLALESHKNENGEMEFVAKGIDVRDVEGQARTKLESCGKTQGTFDVVVIAPGKIFIAL